ncbi:MAG: hypothetical protein IJA66_01650 [Alistipes sp.]|nr:hypothetical protein [Alistipes sp.]
MTERKGYIWSEWRDFPDPRKLEYLYAPIGFGVYRLRNKETKEYILFGKSKHVARRMSSLLPAPLGSGTRTNEAKRKYVLENLSAIEYQTLALANAQEITLCEKMVKNSNSYIFNT